MQRQLRERVAEEQSRGGQGAASEEELAAMAQRVLSGRLKQGRDAAGQHYYDEDDDEEPWNDACDTCGVARPTAAAAAGARWLKCLLCPALDLCASCAAEGCPTHGRSRLVAFAQSAHSACGGAGAGKSCEAGWTPERDVRLLDAAWTHRLNVRTVAQAVGGPTASCSDERDTAEAEAGARLLCLLAPQHRAAPPQTHAPLLTPPIEVEELGAPPSHGFRLALAGAAPTGAAEKEEAPRKKCLSALLRLSACALEESAKWSSAVGAAGKLYKQGELDAASPAPPPDHAAYSLAGCSPYAPSQLAHAGLRAVGLPPIEQRYLPSGVPTAQARCVD